MEGEHQHPAPPPQHEPAKFVPSEGPRFSRLRERMRVYWRQRVTRYRYLLALSEHLQLDVLGYQRG